jgi:hypothetical protein
VLANTNRLVQRVDELEDLVIELKQKQSATDIAELKQLISQLQLESAGYIEKIKLLSEARVTAKELFTANELHSSYLTVMKDREKIIEKLYAEVKKVSKKNALNQPVG